jgi:hypothetical protein
MKHDFQAKKHFLPLYFWFFFSKLPKNTFYLSKYDFPFPNYQKNTFCLSKFDFSFPNYQKNTFCLSKFDFSFIWYEIENEESEIERKIILHT